MKLYWCSLICLTGILVYSIVLLHFNEDIREFMPLEDSDKESFGVYENLSGANRLFVLFSNPGDEDMTVEAIEHFLGEVQELNTSGWCREITAQVDENIISEATDFVYGHIPYFLTDSDYRRMDSLLALPHYVTEQLARDRELLMLPTGAMLTQHVARDPLNLFAPVMESLRRSNPQSSFELYDGYIFTGDLSCGIVMVTSPFGNSETEHNSQLLGLLNLIREQPDHYSKDDCLPLEDGGEGSCVEVQKRDLHHAPARRRDQCDRGWTQPVEHILHSSAVPEFLQKADDDQDYNYVRRDDAKRSKQRADNPAFLCYTSIYNLKLPCYM